MPKRSSKPPSDPNRAARRVLDHIIAKTEAQEKNPAAVALGRLGGLKGGKARAAKLSKRRRSEIATDAARKRWADRKE